MADLDAWWKALFLEVAYVVTNRINRQCRRVLSMSGEIRDVNWVYHSLPGLPHDFACYIHDI